tara:strand:- start:405 stop:815 length:411 start_codon:yes stop_codon:yes gene_type:complete
MLKNQFLNIKKIQFYKEQDMNLVDKIKKNIPESVIGVGAFILITGVAMPITSYIAEVRKKNLAPNAIDLGNNDFVRIGNDLRILRENIDKDPRKESVLEFYDKDGNKQEIEIYWDENHYPKIGSQDDNPTIPYSEK